MIDTNKVSAFTPVESEQNPLIKLAAEYLSPLSCIKRVAVYTEGNEEIDGSKGVTAKAYETTFCATLIKIATYILSAGIFPLIALIVAYSTRCCHKFHWIDDAEEIQPLQRQRNPAPQQIGLGAIPRDAETRVNEPSENDAEFDALVKTYIASAMSDEDLRAFASTGKEEAAVNEAIRIRKGDLAPSGEVEADTEIDSYVEFLQAGMSEEDLRSGLANDAQHVKLDEAVRRTTAAAARVVQPAPRSAQAARPMPAPRSAQAARPMPAPASAPRGAPAPADPVNEAEVLQYCEFLKEGVTQADLKAANPTKGASIAEAGRRIAAGTAAINAPAPAPVDRQPEPEPAPAPRGAPAAADPVNEAEVNEFMGILKAGISEANLKQGTPAKAASITEAVRRVKAGIASKSNAPQFNEKNVKAMIAQEMSMEDVQAILKAVDKSSQEAADCKEVLELLSGKLPDDDDDIAEDAPVMVPTKAADSTVVQQAAKPVPAPAPTGVDQATKPVDGAQARRDAIAALSPEAAEARMNALAVLPEAQQLTRNTARSAARRSLSDAEQVEYNKYVLLADVGLTMAYLDAKIASTAAAAKVVNQQPEPVQDDDDALTLLAKGSTSSPAPKAEETVEPAPAPKAEETVEPAPAPKAEETVEPAPAPKAEETVAPALLKPTAVKINWAANQAAITARNGAQRALTTEEFAEYQKLVGYDVFFKMAYLDAKIASAAKASPALAPASSPSLGAVLGMSSPRLADPTKVLGQLTTVKAAIAAEKSSPLLEATEDDDALSRLGMVEDPAPTSPRPAPVAAKPVEVEPAPKQPSAALLQLREKIAARKVAEATETAAPAPETYEERTAALIAAAKAESAAQQKRYEESTRARLDEMQALMAMLNTPAPRVVLDTRGPLEALRDSPTAESSQQNANDSRHDAKIKAAAEKARLAEEALRAAEDAKTKPKAKKR